jgi:hypothetical protein
MVQFIATLLAIVALGYSHYLIFRALTWPIRALRRRTRSEPQPAPAPKLPGTTHISAADFAALLKTQGTDLKKVKLPQGA